MARFFKLFVIMLIFNLAFGAKLNFRDGSTLEGKVKQITEDKIILEFEFGDVERLRSEVISITKIMPSEEDVIKKAPMPKNNFEHLKNPQSTDNKVSENDNKKKSNKKVVKKSVTAKDLNHNKNKKTETENITNKSEPQVQVDDAVNESNKQIAEHLQSVMQQNTMKNLLSDSEEKDSSDDNYTVFDNSAIQESAYNSLLVLKNKLNEQHTAEKNELQNQYQKEKSILEENLENLTQKYTDLKKQNDELTNSCNNFKNEISQKNELILKNQKTIADLKNQFSDLNTKKIQVEIKTAEELKNSLIKNKELLDNEKKSLIESYEGQIQEFKKHFDVLNAKTQEISKENSDINSKLSNSERLNEDLTLQLKTKEQEFENYKLETTKKINDLSSKNSSSAIEAAISNHAETITELRNEITQLNTENQNLKNNTNRLDSDLKTAKQEISALENEKEKYKNDILKFVNDQKNIKDKNKKQQEKFVKSLVDSVLTETKTANQSDVVEIKPSETSKPATEVQSLPKKSNPISMELYRLYQEDINNFSEKLKAANDEILKLKERNLILDSELNKTKTEYQKTIQEKQISADTISKYEAELKDAKTRAEKSEQAKNDLKSEIENTIQQIRQTSKNIAASEPKPVLKETPLLEEKPKPIEKIEEPEVDVGEEDVKSKNIENTQIENKEQIQEISPTATENVIQKNTTEQEETKSIEVGTISQIEPEFSRIFIDTKEILKEGDQIFVSTTKGEAPFKIIKVYQSLNGAIAEIQIKDLMKYIKNNEVVYVK